MTRIFRATVVIDGMWVAGERIFSTRQACGGFASVIDDLRVFAANSAAENAFRWELVHKFLNAVSACGSHVAGDTTSE